MSEHRYDVIIIGGSYSGLSAAMALGRSRRNVLVIDAGNPCNKSTPYSHNFLTQDGVPPQVISNIAKDQVLAYPTIQWQDGRVCNILGNNEAFETAMDGGKKVMARKVILATGLKDVLPEIAGFKECWGKTIIHCPYCHGYEFRDQKTGIFVAASQAFEMVKLISNWTNDLKVFLSDNEKLSEEHRHVILGKGVQIISQPIHEAVHQDGILSHLTMADNSTEQIKALYARVPTEQKISFLNKMGCTMTESGHIETDMFGKTTVEGVYAVGDCSHPMRSVATAVYTGNIAGAMINKELIEESYCN
ncbi:MAG: NAD(P)/FAD-dependent oxidoreductase [Cytophagia bacterium]|nr:NAD(P)/FAD-dependent oxidoreductase [Cytophagia bacterium]